MKTALQFSGGKDSLALLYFLQPEWDDLLVMWCNTGAAYESTRDMMLKVQAMVPHFIEIHGNQPQFLSQWGWPADIVPLATTPFGHAVHGTRGECFVSAYACCNANIWQPLAMACKALGITKVYRGQRSVDWRKGPIQDGHIEDGIAYFFPIYDWTDKEVFDFLGERVPDHYRAGEKTSRDCWNCTAYLDENAARIAALPKEQRAFVIGKLDILLARLHAEQAVIEMCMHKGG